ncbi:Rv0909 family putative TA system antitoxin [Phycicoccus sonneratiae]|uniref:Antitoxin n=1 Tax=Phycicoccus sonneratiae TaxID=2807628 RepID=A0ABS2CMD4_9MICO|nr:Rv0909 family putative TA system antitoxin [Phycicoccus sonneraticus]MBM6401045.1 hypothetical protein [Phycicoccus sonneraticus]
MAKGRAAALVAAATTLKKYVRENPDRAADAIGKVEGFVRSKAGPQHADKVGKGGAALRKGLGLPPSGGSTGASGTSGGGQVPPPPPPPSSGPTS